MNMNETDFNEMMKAPTKSYLEYKGYYNTNFYRKMYDFAFTVHNKLKNLNYYGKRAD